MNNLNTGDILLFSPDKSSNYFFRILDLGIRYFTKSEFTHVAMVLKNPTFIHNNLKGLYIWESSWEGTPDPQDDKIKLGVQITPLHEFLDTYKGKIYVRKLKKGNNLITIDKLQDIHKIVYDKPYDYMPKDWINAINRYDSEPQKTSRFWCSALVCFILSKLGFVNKSLDWSLIRPSDLSSTTNFVKFIDCCNYSGDIEIYSN
jgi:hypothetical protein